MCVRQLDRGDPTSSSYNSVMCCSPNDDQGNRGILPIVCAYIFYICKIQINQVCITDYVGLCVKVAYLYLVYSLCALHFYECKQIVIVLSTSSVNNLSVSIFFDSISVILSSLLLAEFCSSPCTLHHSRY